MNEIFYRACRARGNSSQNQSVHLNLIKICCDAGTCQIITDTFGRDAGYICWANVCKEIEDIFLTYQENPKYFYEYNEGETCLLLEIFLTPNHNINLNTCLRDFSKYYNKVIYERRGKRRILQRAETGHKFQYMLI